MSFESITNRGEFFSNHYLESIIGGDLGALRSRWDDLEGRDEPSARSRLRGLPSRFFAARAEATEATRAGRAAAVKRLNDVVLTALGFTPARTELALVRATTDTLQVPVAAHVTTGTGVLLVALDAGLAADVDDLFSVRDDDAEPAGRLLAPLWRVGDKKQVVAAADAIGEIFSVDEPPRFVLVAGGRVVLLAERAKWAEGRFLAVDLDAALERHDTKARGELEMIAALFSADALVPADGDGEGDGQIVLDELVDKSHKHAVGVSKELRAGIRDSIEILANEVIACHDEQARQNRRKQFSRTDVDARELTRQCLRWLYRMLVLLYAESRPELGIVPADDDAYVDGYSLDRLRELTLVELDTDRARNGTHLHTSLMTLFELVNAGYHAEHAQQMLALDAASEQDSREEYLQFPGLDAALFDTTATPWLDEVPLRNEALQKVLALLMLSPEGKGKRADRGFISYAQLGINQLGAVYEGLMAYSGFFATEPLYEVAKGGDPSDGTWVLPVDQADGYPDEVFVQRVDPVTGRSQRVRHEPGSFVFRLSGRDRQRSASYYTPEVLTRCVVEHALAELLGLDDYAPEHGSSGITEAAQILDLTICEPALGSGAFANEAINQLSAEYLRRRQAELGESLNAEEYLRELQRVKAHFALHQTYGVDLNGTAIELAEVSLWLNAMYPGLKAPWFGLQLRRGNSLIGCRRATWRTTQLPGRPWAKTKTGEVTPPVDRKLSDGPLDHDEIHHFLLPGHGWAAAADRKEAKELRPDEVERLKAWRKQILAAPTKHDAKRLTRVAGRVEELWTLASERIRLVQRSLRRPIPIYGMPAPENRAPISRREAERFLGDPDSPLGRLRTLMDAWVGLWFWPFDTGTRPPSWNDWLTTAEALLDVDADHDTTGQLELFDDLDELFTAEQQRLPTSASVEATIEQNPWLRIALGAARNEGAWHWELEFAPVFERGGFDLQVGNPPWVRPIWNDDLVLAEIDPWWGITDKAPTKVRTQRRSANLDSADAQSVYISELCSAEATAEVLGSAVLRPLLAGVQTNLYMAFMDSVWRQLHPRGTSGLLHPESHFTDPKAAPLRSGSYRRLRRHFQFFNGLLLFEEVHDQASFGVHIYGAEQAPLFLQMSCLQSPVVIDNSLDHDGGGEPPALQHPAGGWDLRPHLSRVLTITEEVLSDWARLFDEPGTRPGDARLLRAVTVADLEALSVLAAQPARLSDHPYRWTAGWHEKAAKDLGTIRWETATPDSWGEVILQGPHFTIATPFAKQPNEDCRHRQDYTEWNLEGIPERLIPRTNYQLACDRPTYDSRLDNWDGIPYVENWRVAWRRMTHPSLERSLHSAMIPRRSAHVGTVCSAALAEPALTVRMAGLFSTLPIDYLVKVSGRGDLWIETMSRYPLPIGSLLYPAIVLRSLRLNCLTADYSPLWEELFDERWQADRWTDPMVHRLDLSDVGPTWSMATPLRRDEDRRRALVELDALAALMLGLSAEQLCAMYRTQFAVLRKYEYKMVFDAEGRKICGYHQSAGYRQSELQDRAKAGELPAEWKNLWKLYEQYEEDPSSVDWLGHYTPPFTRADREKEMTVAYEEFQRRLDAGEYDEA